MGTHLRVLSESYPMGTKWQGLEVFQKSFLACALDKNSLSIMEGLIWSQLGSLLDVTLTKIVSKLQEQGLHLYQDSIQEMRWSLMQWLHNGARSSTMHWLHKRTLGQQLRKNSISSIIASFLSKVSLIVELWLVGLSFSGILLSGKGFILNPYAAGVKKAEKWPKPWQMGIHLKVLDESFPMNTKMIGFRRFSKIFEFLCLRQK